MSVAECEYQKSTNRDGVSMILTGVPVQKPILPEVLAGAQRQIKLISRVLSIALQNNLSVVWITLQIPFFALPAHLKLIIKDVGSKTLGKEERWLHQVRLLNPDICHRAMSRISLATPIVLSRA